MVRLDPPTFEVQGNTSPMAREENLVRINDSPSVGDLYRPTSLVGPDTPKRTLSKDGGKLTCESKDAEVSYSPKRDDKSS